jgi:HptB-dependent secretion and biofilm anti anti-sigma factor
MNVETCTYSGRFEAALSGRLTSADLVAFRDLLSQIKESKCNLVLIDLKNLSWIDSAGLGMLLLARETAAKGNLELVLRAPQGDVKSLLQLGRFETLFNVQF